MDKFVIFCQASLKRTPIRGLKSKAGSSSHLLAGPKPLEP
jgi:hypothetical protein